MDIVVKVIDQKLRIETSLRCLVAGSQRFVRFVFDLPDEWKSLHPFAQFAQNGVGYNVYLDSEWSCFLPTEIEEGECTMMLYGTDGTIIGTTGAITLFVDENKLIVDAESTDISQSLYDQLMSMIGSVDTITITQIDALFT